MDNLPDAGIDAVRTFHEGGLLAHSRAIQERQDLEHGPGLFGEHTITEDNLLALNHVTFETGKDRQDFWIKLYSGGIQIFNIMGYQDGGDNDELMFVEDIDNGVEFARKLLDWLKQLDQAGKLVPIKPPNVGEISKSMQELIDDTVERLQIVDESTEFHLDNEYTIVRVWPAESAEISQAFELEEQPRLIEELCIDGAKVNRISSHNVTFRGNGKIRYDRREKLEVKVSETPDVKELWYVLNEYNDESELPESLIKIISRAREILPTLTADQA